jgi:hypothetical protein
MAIEKLVPQYLNKDEDERLVKPFEMTDALNVRVSHETDGTQGIIKNVEGTTAVLPAVNTADAIPSSGDNRVIGVVPCEAGKCMYFFLYNSANNHGIYRYDSATDRYEKLYQDSVLNFQRDAFVKGDVVINQHQEHLLYFTDNRNEPRKLNATKLLLGNYDANLTGGTAIQKQKFLTVCKQPPQTAATFRFITNPTIGSNNLKESCFQFTYQYVYDDGEVSALGIYSDLAVSPTNMAFNAPAMEFLGGENNELEVTVTNSDGPVRKIRVFARKNNDQLFLKVAELDNNVAGGTQSFIFRNDGVYPALSDEEANKPFDAVPRLASSQAICGGRLMYGDYVEGFDNIENTDVYAYNVFSPRSATAVNLNLPVLDGATEVLTDSSTNKEKEEFLAADIGGAVPFGFFVSPTESFARFADSTTDGINFNLDLSNFPVLGLEDNQGVVDFNVNISASKIGFAATGADGTGANTRQAYTTATYYNNGGNLINADDMFVLDSDEIFNGIALKPVGNLTFQSQYPAPTATTQAELFAWIQANIVGTIGQVSCTFLSEPLSGPPSAPNPLSGASAMLQKSAGAQSPGTNADADRLAVWLEGVLDFQIYSAEFDGATNNVKFKIRCVNVDLEAVQAVAPLQINNAGAIIGNDFVDTTNGTLLAGTHNGGASLNQFQAYLFDSSDISLIINSQYNNPTSGFSLNDFSSSSGAIRSYFFDYEVASGSLDVIQSDGADLTSFKAGAAHDFGIVYYDHRNRASGVQKIGDVNVPHFGSSQRQGREGRTSVDLRLIHEPPPWATKWAPVYSKNNTYEKVLQVSVAEAALGKKTDFADIRSSDGTKTRPVLQGLEGGINGQIFISMRPLEGKSNSYRDFKGAEISYEYKEGDVLRVLEYVGSQGIVRPMNEFKITSYQFYSDDDQNPIKLTDSTSQDDEDNYRRTGWFLTIRDNSTPGFDRDSVRLGTDFFSQRCLVEIYRPKRATEEKLYYEVGEQYDIIEVGGARTHAGDRSNSTSPTFSISVVSGNRFTSDQRLYRGDRVLTTASSTGYVFVDNLFDNGDGTNTYIIHPSNPFTQATIGSSVGNNTITAAGNNGLFPGVITLDQGDVYMRIREQLSNPEIDYTPTLQSDITRAFSPIDVDSAVYVKYVVEDERVSDFFDSMAVSIGRPHIETPEQREISRNSAVTYSEPFVSDSARLNLSSFNPVLFPFKDYNSADGFITYLVDKGESLLVLQEKKISATPVGRQLIEAAQDGMLVTSKNVLGTETYYAGIYGPGRNPESVVDRFGITYFADMEAGKVVRVSSKGIEPISDVKLESFFENLFADLLVREQIPRIPCGFDPENSEYIVTVEGQQVNDITIGSTNVGDVPLPPTNPRIAGANGKLKSVASFENLPTWDKEALSWESDVIRPVERLPQWNTIGTAVMYVDRLTERASVFIEPQIQRESETIEMDLVHSKGSFRGVCQFNPGDGSVLFPTHCVSIAAAVADDASIAVSVAAGTDDAGKTIAWGATKNFWLSLYSFNPEMYANLHNRFFSFENGQIHRHNVNSTYNNFYGTQYNSVVEVVSKENPSSVKVYNALSLEGNDTWSAVVSNTQQTTNITEPMYEEREGMYYTVIPKDITSNSTANMSHKVVLGRVASKDGNKVKITSRISNLPFSIGDAAYLLAASSETNLSATINSVDSRTEVTLSDASGVSVGDILMALSQDEINGDKIRDYHAKIKLTNDNTGAVELFAVNAAYSRSPLHNDQKE